MKVETISLEDTGYFSSLLLDYINKSEALQDLYNTYPSPENFKSVIKNRKSDPEKREIVRKALLDMTICRKCYARNPVRRYAGLYRIDRFYGTTPRLGHNRV